MGCDLLLNFFLILLLLIEESRGLSCREDDSGKVCTHCNCTSDFRCYIRRTSTIVYRGCHNHVVEFNLVHDHFCSTNEVVCCSTFMCNNGSTLESMLGYHNESTSDDGLSTTTFNSEDHSRSSSNSTEDIKRRHMEKQWDLLAILAVLPVSSIGLITILGILYCLVIKRRRTGLNGRCRTNIQEDEHQCSAINSVFSSGSGSGLPLVIKRSVARLIHIGEPIGSGRFGQVFLGDYQGEEVAVKKFHSRDEQSWSRELEVYNTTWLHHENILGFFASDMISNDGVTELWLITRYHPHGSLYDYLIKNTVSPAVMMRMCLSISRGLAHLHSELLGISTKPAIAHRDIKSKNIMVKNDLECCIGDFGLSVIKVNNEVKFPTNPKQGSKRYLAPEILDETINMLKFDSFVYADIYALGLVLWEICSRCKLDCTMSKYEPPFYNLVPSDPSLEIMKKIVVNECQRPRIPSAWLQSKMMRGMVFILRECWYRVPSARPTAQAVKQRLHQLFVKQEDK